MPKDERRMPGVLVCCKFATGLRAALAVLRSGARMLAQTSLRIL